MALELLIRSTVLLLAGLALRRACAQLSAHFRHRLLLFVALLLSLLPILWLALPQFTFILWHTPAATGRVTVYQWVIADGPRAQNSTWHPLLTIWLAGVVIALIPYLRSLRTVSKTRRRARPFPSTASNVLISSDIQVPIAAGIRKPVIILPASAASWTEAHLNAVLSHEQSHIARLDIAAQAFAQIVAALWWFQPLAWLLRRALRDESELACDAEVIRQGTRPSDYADALLAIARSVHGPYPSSAAGMLRPNGLETRLRAVLAQKEKTPTLARVLAIATILGAVTWASSAAVTDPQRGSNMKKVFLSTLITSVGLSAATVDVLIQDANGAAVANAKVKVSTAPTFTPKEMQTSADGKFKVTTDGGPVIFTIEKPGLATLHQELNVSKDAAAVTREFIMVPDANSSELLPVVPESSQQRIRIGGQVAQANLVTKVNPTYPIAAKKAGIQGTVQIDAVISKEGIPTELRVLSSPSDDLSESALDAVSQWQYRPILLNGQPVEVEALVIVNYTLAP